MYRAAWLLALLPFSAVAAPPPCASTVTELKELLEDALFPLAWEETSMRDARPLLLALDEREGRLFISFAKSGEGLWAEGDALLCRSAGGLEARFTAGRIRTGPAAGWLLRRALHAGAAITLRRTGLRELRVGTIGWSGHFTPASPRVGLKAP